MVDKDYVKVKSAETLFEELRSSRASLVVNITSSTNELMRYRAELKVIDRKIKDLKTDSDGGFRE